MTAVSLSSCHLPPHFGRTRKEIEQLDRRLAAARDGRGGAVFLLGDPGIGKSRLSAECAYQAFDTGMVALRGRGGGVSADIPFKPLCEALLSYTRTKEPPDDPALMPYLPALTKLVPEWRRAGVADHLESVMVLAEAVLRLLAVIGRDGGCLLVLEDLHDADADTLAVVEYLADNLADVPAFLLANARSHAGRRGPSPRPAPSGGPRPSSSSRPCRRSSSPG